MLGRLDALVRAAPLVGILMLTLGSSLASGPVHADPGEAADPAVAADEGSTAWGPIIGACFGVLFGGGLALWQIRGMKKRG